MPLPASYAIPRTALAVLQPPPRLSVSQWCDRHRYLHRKHTAEPGRWRTSRVPYLREPLDAITDPDLESITFIKCSRVGGTEWMLNILGFSADARPMPALYVEPTKPMAEREFKGRIRSLFEDSRQLRRHIPPGEWANVNKISLDSMDIYAAWATSDQTLISLTIGLIVFNEIDNIVKQNGALGDILDVAVERVTTFGRRGRTLVNGTPTTTDAPGWRALQRSDYRRPFLPCPKCGTYQVLQFDRIKLPPGHEHVRDPDAIRIDQLGKYQCEGCDEYLDWRKHHAWMIARVVWIPRGQEPAEPLPVKQAGYADAAIKKNAPISTKRSANQTKGGRLKSPAKRARDIVDRRSLACLPADQSDERWTPKLEGDAPRTTHRGYWVSVLYSPWESRTWSHILARFFEVKDQPEQFRVFMNSWLAQAWEDAVAAADHDTVAKKREGDWPIPGPNHPTGGGSYPPERIPPEARIVLMGADVQGETRADQFPYIIRAFGPFMSSWPIREGAAGSLDELYHIAFHTGFPILGLNDDNSDGTPTLIRCHAMAIDSRYRKSEVYPFAERPGVVLVKGVDEADTALKAFPLRRLPNGQADPTAPRYQQVDTSYFKGLITRHLAIPRDQRGYFGIHRDASDAYLKHITNEHQVREQIKQGRRAGQYHFVWKPKTAGSPVDLWDCEVYCFALAQLLNVPLMRPDAERVGVMGAAPKRPPRRARSADDKASAGDGWGGFLG